MDILWCRYSSNPTHEIKAVWYYPNAPTTEKTMSCVPLTAYRFQRSIRITIMRLSFTTLLLRNTELCVSFIWYRVHYSCVVRSWRPLIFRMSQKPINKHTAKRKIFHSGTLCDTKKALHSWLHFIKTCYNPPKSFTRYPSVQFQSLSPLSSFFCCSVHTDCFNIYYSYPTLP